MNNAEHRRNVRICAMTDLELLEALIKDDADVKEDERVILLNMRTQITNHLLEQSGNLSNKQRVWAEEVARRVVPIKSSDVPKGRDVPTPAVLQNAAEALKRKRRIVT